MDEPRNSRRLLRSRDDRYIGGVAAGVADYFSIDPTLVRVAFVLSLAFGGIGLIAYVVLLALMPVEGPPGEPLPPISDRRRNLMIGGAVVVGILLVLSVDSGGFGHWVFGFGPGPLFGVIFWSAALIAAVWLGVHLLSGGGPGAGGRAGSAGREPSAGTLASSPTQNAPADRLPEAGPDDLVTGILPGEQPTDVMPGSRRPSAEAPGGPGTVPGGTAPAGTAGAGGSRFGSIVGRVMLVIAVGITALIALGLLAGLAAWVTAQFGGVPMALLVIGLGGAMIIAAVQGRNRLSLWLLVSALSVAIPMAAITLADLRIDGSYGAVRHDPVRTADIPPEGYSLAAGRMVVDLRRLPFHPGQTVPLKVKSGFGMTSVVIPDRVCVAGRVTGAAGLSDIRGREASGVDVNHRLSPPAAGHPGLRLEADFKLGLLEVVDATDWKRSGGLRGRADRDGSTRAITDSVAARKRADLACTEQPRPPWKRNRN